MIEFAQLILHTLASYVRNCLKMVFCYSFFILIHFISFHSAPNNTNCYYKTPVSPFIFSDRLLVHVYFNWSATAASLFAEIDVINEGMTGRLLKIRDEDR